MRIAIADDEIILMKFLEKTVRELKPEAEVTAFSDAFDLIEAAKTQKYDVAFLDIMMPGMTGLELAKDLLEQNKKLNIIFVTGYDGYQGEAMDLFASGYVKKPVTREKIAHQFDNLRFPAEEKKRVYAQTFGNFTLFVDGKPVSFARKKSQMALAYLVHRKGSLVDKKELSAAVFEDGVYDEARRNYVSKICADITDTLASVNAESLLQRTATTLAVNCDALECDLYDFLAGKPGAKEKYRGEYMSQYSFGEDMIPFLEKN